jgi:hypothetical protein
MSEHFYSTLDLHRMPQSDLFRTVPKRRLYTGGENAKV